MSDFLQSDELFCIARALTSFFRGNDPAQCTFVTSEIVNSLRGVKTFKAYDKPTMHRVIRIALSKMVDHGLLTIERETIPEYRVNFDHPYFHDKVGLICAAHKISGAAYTLNNRPGEH